MPCFHPLKAYRTLESTSNGKKRIVFRKSAQYSHPILLPCSQCSGCRLDHSLMWAIRCVNEAQLHDQNCFITLTYSNEHRPPDGSLVKQHFQDFIRSLRKRSKTKIRYFMCGEYGEKFTRPHFHACLFGIDFLDKEIFREDEGILTYTSEKLATTWGKGFCTLGELNFETAAYTARYVTKKINGEKKDEHYTTSCPITGNLIHLQPEYATMSRRPGLAKNWYEKYKSDVYPSDFLIHKGIKVKPPRYYDNLYEIDNDLEEIKLARKQRARAQLWNNTPERLAVREEVKRLNSITLKRNYENHDT